MLNPSTALLAASTRPRREPPVLRLTRRQWQILAAFAALTLLSVEGYVVAPYVADAGSDVAGSNVALIGAGLCAELVSMMSFARLQRTILRSGGVHVPLRAAASAAFAGNAITVSLPGGSIASLAYTMRRMRSWGAPPALAVFSLAATGVASSAALVLLGVLGSSLAGDRSHVPWLITEALTLAALVAAAIVLIRRPRLRAWIAAHVRRVGGLLDDLAAVHAPAAVWSRMFALALANWTADLLCLALCCRAVGLSPAAGALVLGYVLGMAAASSVPLLPGGIGAVEAAMVLVLVGGGSPVTEATAGVLVYRCISLGLVALAGWVVLAAGLHRRHGREHYHQQTATASPSANSCARAAQLRRLERTGAAAHRRPRRHRRTRRAGR